LRPPKFYAEQGIDLKLNTSVNEIDVTKKTKKIDSETLCYEHLALTTGSTPRLLPTKIGGQLNGVFSVRSLADVDAMQSSFDKGGHVLIIGGGYIGLEAAAVAAARGLRVTLVEMAERILQRVACAETSNYFRDLHQSHGVKILEGIGLDRLTGKDHVDGAVLSNGQTLDIDFAILGVGISPNTTLAEAAGLTQNNGIETDRKGRTSAPNIWAAGDSLAFRFRADVSDSRVFLMPLNRLKMWLLIC
jgi:3-phenylpropionate/trans-cinnamate dioxygenase ferredoxin reductase subunit